MNGLASLDKEAGAFNAAMKNETVQGMGAMVGAALVLKGITGLTDKMSDIKEKQKFNSVINFAKKKHPELKTVPQEKMLNWMDAFHTLSPKISVNKELGSTMLMTAHDYGGNIDLATAKMVADTGAKSGGAGHRDEILGYISGGKTLSGPMSGGKKPNSN